MKKKMNVWTLLTGVTVLSLASCDDDDKPSFVIEPLDPVHPYVGYIVSEGSIGYNNGSITALQNGETLTTTPDFYALANGQKLGDTAQDLICYNNSQTYVEGSGDTLSYYTSGSILVCVAGSNYVARLQEDGKEICRYAFSESDGQPRYMALVDDMLSVSLYSGQVAKLDAKTLALVGYCKVRLRPEQMAIAGDYLYVTNTEYNSSNYTYGNVVSVIDLKTFTVAKEVTVGTNPNRIVAGNKDNDSKSNSKVYVCCWGNYATEGYSIVEIDPAKDWATRTLATATAMTLSENSLYMVNSVTDWTTYETTNTFFSYDINGDSICHTSFLADAPEALASTGIYMLQANADGQIFVGTTDYYSESDIYQFTSEGQLVQNFKSGGINSNKIDFWSDTKLAE